MCSTRLRGKGGNVFYKAMGIRLIKVVYKATW